MRLLGSLQERFGFTRSEIIAVLFLTSTFLAGVGIRILRSDPPQEDLPAYSYARADSIFAARSRNPVVAGEQRRQQSRQPVKKVVPGGQKININTAGAEQIMQLPGIGPGLASRILAYRTAHGPFRRVEDLAGVQGIGKKKLERLRPCVVVP